MFTNPATIWVEVLAIFVAVSIVGLIIESYVYKKIHHIPTGDCAYCHKSKEQLLKEYHKCCCDKTSK